MRAVKGKNKILSLISRPEARIYSMIEADGFISCESLSERDSYIAEELYQLELILQNNEIDRQIYYKKAGAYNINVLIIAINKLGNYNSDIIYKLDNVINILNIIPAFLLKTDCVFIIEYDQTIPIKKLIYLMIILFL